MWNLLKWKHYAQTPRSALTTAKSVIKTPEFSSVLWLWRYILQNLQTPIYGRISSLVVARECKKFQFSMIFGLQFLQKTEISQKFFNVEVGPDKQKLTKNFSTLLSILGDFSLSKKLFPLHL